MEGIKEQETQQELFPGFSGELGKPERFPSLQKTQKPIFFSTSIEQIVFLSILFIILFCFVFFLGVLRGKSIQRRGLPTPVMRQESAGNAQRLRVESAAKALQMQTYRLQDTAAALATQKASYGPSEQTTLAKAVVTKTSTTPPAKQAGQGAVKYTIQLASYKGQNSALREIGILRGRGYKAFLMSSGSYYLVVVGQYAKEADAARDLAALKLKYKDCRLKKISKD